MDRGIKSDLQLHCRTCLNVIKGNKYAVNEFSGSLLSLYQQCIRAVRGEFFPRFLCSKCYWRLKSFDEFNGVCEKSNKYLTELINGKNVGDLETENNSEVDNFRLTILDEPEIVKMPTGEKCTTDDVLDFKELTIEEEDIVRIDDEEDTKVSAEIKESFRTKSSLSFVCKMCKRTFVNSSSLKTHMMTHLKKRPFQSEKCDRALNMECRLKQHKEEVYREVPLEINILQAMQFESSPQIDLERHDYLNTETEHSSESGETNIVTVRHGNNCSPKTAIEFESASQIDFKPNDNQITESLINIEMDTTDKLKRKHQEPLNEKSENDFLRKPSIVCKVCQKIYSSADSLRLHMVTHLKERPYKCEKCERGFNIASRLKYHMDEEHGEIPIRIVCKYGCGKIFRRTETATAHYRNKHNVRLRNSLDQTNEFLLQTDSIQTNEAEQTTAADDLKQIELDPANDDSDDEKLKVDDNFPKTIGRTTCKICFRNCPTLTTLRIHMRFHSNERPFQCDKCGSSFPVKARLNQHIKEMHGEAPFSIECKYGCGKIFHRSSTALTHYRVKHRNILPKDRSQICEQCGKVCRNISFLKEHLLQHIPLEESPLVCSVCGRRFRNRKCMHRHINVHKKKITLKLQNQKHKTTLITLITALLQQQQQ